MTVASTEETNVPETEVVDIQGRDVEIRPLNDAQLALMAREVRIMSKPTFDRTRKMEAAAIMFNILESVVISPEDKEYMNELVVEGKLDLKELTSFVTVFNTEKEAAPAPPKVRRGRPPVKRS